LDWRKFLKGGEEVREKGSVGISTRGNNDL